jgi:hypothetical protein
MEQPSAGAQRAIGRRKRDDTRPEYLDSVRCDSWAVLVPEFVFAPLRGIQA